MEHVVALARLFDDEVCEVQILGQGSREECERFAEMTVAAPYEGPKTVLQTNIVVRTKSDMDMIMAGAEADERAARGRKPS